VRRGAIMENHGPGKEPGALCVRMKEELAFFEEAVERARRWRRSWRSAGDEARVVLLSEHTTMIQELLGRGEALDRIREEWQSPGLRQEGETSKEFLALAARLDTAMRSLLEVEKENFQVTRKDAHRVYARPGDGGPSCVDRKL
jgi:hypothetical protein